MKFAILAFMRIGIIGYGSLVNHSHSDVYDKTLEAKKPEVEMALPQDINLNPNSPFVPAQDLALPVRLGRVSGLGTDQRRITLVLYEGASDEPVFYTESKFTNLNEAIKNLREREGIPATGYKSIGYVNLQNGSHRSRIDDVAARISDWATRNHFDAVIWTDLPTKGVEFGPQSTGREILPLLEADPTLLKNTKNYISDLPFPPNALQKTILEISDVSGEEEEAYRASLTADFAHRDTLPQSDVPKNKWFIPEYGMWGPKLKKFPPAIIPEVVNPVQWKRDRVIEAAKHFTGLPYKRADGQRGHFPARGCGLDCSNYVSWVYNYALGQLFTSDVDEQWSSNYTGGRKLNPGEELQKGDLVFFSGDPKHVVIYIDENHIIDSTSSRPEGVQVRDVRKPHNKWCRPTPDNPRYLGVRRFIE